MQTKNSKDLGVGWGINYQKLNSPLCLPLNCSQRIKCTTVTTQLSMNSEWPTALVGHKKKERKRKCDHTALFILFPNIPPPPRVYPSTPHITVTLKPHEPQTTISHSYHCNKVAMHGGFPGRHVFVLENFPFVFMQYSRIYISGTVWRNFESE